MTGELKARCPGCGWENDGELGAAQVYDHGSLRAVDGYRLFLDGEVDGDQDCDEDGVSYTLNDVRECPRCEHDTDNVAEWVGTWLLFHFPSVSVQVAETEAEGLDAIAREEADTVVPRARRSDPGTSHQAAASVRQLTAKQRAVRTVLRRYGSLTDEQIREKYDYEVRMAGLPVQSESGLRTRRAELVRRGDVVDTGDRRVMSTGRKAIVWGLA